MLGMDGALYLYNAATKTWAQKGKLTGTTSSAMALDLVEETFVMIGHENGLYAYKEATFLHWVGGTEMVKGVCFAGGRVFCAIKPFSVMYSAAYEPLNVEYSLEHGGQIMLTMDKGETESIAAMNNKVFVFFEHGIMELEYSGSSRDFEIRDIGYDGGKIFGSSVGVCSLEQDKAYFLAENGIYAFNGKGVKRVAQNLDIKPITKGQVCVHLEFDGKYYLSFISENGQRRAVVVDGETGLGYETFALESVGVLNGDAVCTVDGKIMRMSENGELLPGESARFFASDIDFGVRGRKTLKTLELYGTGTATVCVSCGLKKKSKTVVLDKNPKLNISWKGESFGLEILLEKGARMTGATAEIVYLSGNTKRRFA
jgi:hypothetical protein